MLIKLIEKCPIVVSCTTVSSYCTYQPIYKDKAQLHTSSRLFLLLLNLSRERTLRVLRCEEAPIMHSGQCCVKLGSTFKRAGLLTR